MKILSISSILPIPGFINTNDFVLKTYNQYRQLYDMDQIVIIKPVKYDINPLKILKKKTLLYKLKKDFRHEINGFRVEILPFFSSWSMRNLHAIITNTVYYLNTRLLSSLFTTNKFDIIHAQYIFPDGLLAFHLSKKFKIPYVLTTHNERFYFDHIISRKLALKIIKNAVRVFPINYDNYLYYKALDLSNIELLPLGFNSNFIRSQKTDFNKKTSILTVAELIKLKNIDKVLMAFAKLVDKYDISYTIIGRGPEKENLMRLADKLRINRYVKFLDYVPHEIIANEMYKHDIFIMPSFFETFGRVYFEAMAMGIPIICAQHSGIAGIFKEYDEGISVNHNNLEEISKALEFLIINPKDRLRIGENGKKLVEKYTWENIAKSLHSEYIDILKS